MRALIPQPSVNSPNALLIELIRHNDNGWICEPPSLVYKVQCTLQLYYIAGLSMTPIAYRINEI